MQSDLMPTHLTCFAAKYAIRSWKLVLIHHRAHTNSLKRSRALLLKSKSNIVFY